MTTIINDFFKMVDLEFSALSALEQYEFYDIMNQEFVAHDELGEDDKNYNTKHRQFKGLLITSKTKYNQLMKECEPITIRYYMYLIKCWNNKIPFTDMKICMNMKSLFVSLSKVNRITTRYLKLPEDWMSIGYFGGVMEDLVVVCRTITQLEISDSQLITIPNFIKNYRIYSLKSPENAGRFTFLKDLFSSNDDSYVTAMLMKAISFQGFSRRIGIFDDGNDKYMYAIQGLFNCQFDPRVVKVLTNVIAQNEIPYAIHFTQKEIANAIWNKLTTSSAKSNDDNIPVGEICRFSRVIHAITAITKTDKGFQIGSSLKNLKDRMTHGIKPKENGRKKYESGLVIDLVKLVSILPPSTVMMNELGTLLVDKNIPHECLIDCIDTDEKLDYFWGDLD
jgi:Leucine-rich repeat (LRR) protein